MVENTDLTSRQLYAAFKEAYPGVEASLSTVKRARRDLGWTTKRTRYCQLISDVNKEKRMEWCLDRVIAGDLEFDDVIWTDECSVQLESHRKITYHKQGQPLTKKCLKRACARACTVYDPRSQPRTARALACPIACTSVSLARHTLMCVKLAVTCTVIQT